MHPRPDKFSHAAMYSMRTGKAGRRVPECALLCNLPRPGEQPALLEHEEVDTFFHEFGHLLHHIFAGAQRWAGIAGIRTERDFIEAPSQLLEEWTRDPATLATFAVHHQTGEPVPASLVAQLRAADEFGKGLWVRQQMFYAALSLELYRRDPAELDPLAVEQATERLHAPFAHLDGTYLHLSFGHLDGYSATYYTYMWSLVIAKDLFTRFDPAALLDPGVAGRYRETVLAAGGSAPAAELVRSFLGRDYTVAAYRRWLDREPSPPLIRPAHSADAGAVADIWHQGWRDGHLGNVPEQLAAVRTPESFTARAAERVGDTVVATVDDAVAGFVMVVGDEVEQVYVAKPHRGTGVAARLLAEAERLVGAHGHDRAWLAVVAGNARARRFYEREGWRDAGDIRHPAPTATGAIPVTARRYEKHTTLEEPWIDR
jgi:GNAT superfamily N-acetyltransferase